ncbi:DUF202 domain-containing protein [Mangrovimicrobium sediminis]|uniref:DUF202 domain-containing protein n=1 Tax=Mangrovimicrobium sediminis TaxID=2562682 RepID=UPI0014369E24|nr:DUF202 domain-containing protein [Haliea sp. SAOS-164]
MKNYRDHAANERTWLAWIRTAIAIIAFGFIIERFELFSRYVTASLGKQGAEALVPGVNPLAALLVSSGVAVIIFATVRFARHQRMIESESEEAYRSGPAIIGLSVFLVLVSLVLGFLVL